MKTFLLLCVLTIPSGSHLVTLTAYYAHEDPAKALHPYTYSTSKYFTGPGTVRADAEGHPAAIGWQIDGETVMTCGEIPWPNTPDRIFRDGFGTGDTSRWTTQGD